MGAWGLTIGGNGRGEEGDLRAFEQGTLCGELRRYWWVRIWVWEVDGQVPVHRIPYIIHPSFFHPPSYGVVTCANCALTLQFYRLGISASEVCTVSVQYTQQTRPGTRDVMAKLSSLGLGHRL